MGRKTETERDRDRERGQEHNGLAVKTCGNTIVWHKQKMQLGEPKRRPRRRGDESVRITKHRRQKTQKLLERAKR